MDDDKNLSLSTLALRHNASIVSQLVEIGSEGNQQAHSKFLSYVSELECLRPNGTQLRRRCIDASSQHKYVALSYTCKASEHESEEFGHYLVEDWDSSGLQPSTVRNCVFDRILRYMSHAKIDLLWIDAHCIHQSACDGAHCHHTRCTQKRDAMQAMDLVYQLSYYPVALLGRPLKDEDELHLLGTILSEDIINDDSELRRPVATSFHVARRALGLLNDITQDRWWTRAWTFQENYRGGTWMQLLIRHDPGLELQKLRYTVFGRIPGELCVDSVHFSEEATRLCLALRKAGNLLLPADVGKIDNVLRAAGRYSLMLGTSDAMTPTVMADIEARGLSEPWDRLAILANCCKYALRLDVKALQRQGRSLSLSVLAMCSLNGEILDNGHHNRRPANMLTPSEFLDTYAFRAFNAPEEEARRLTFIKGCRLTAVQLTAGGTATEDHLWKLGRIVDAARFWRRLPWIDEPDGCLTLRQRKCLLQLVFKLNDLGYSLLAKKIDKYLEADARGGSASFTSNYLHRMATELAAAIDAGKKLRLGALWDSRGQSSPYRAVFVLSDEGSGRADSQVPDFVFTSVWQNNPGSEELDANDLDHHVSLGVDLEIPSARGGVPRLRVRSWLLGMCFFDECPLTKVVFPWPKALKEI